LSFDKHGESQTNDDRSEGTYPLPLKISAFDAMVRTPDLETLPADRRMAAETALCAAAATTCVAMVVSPLLIESVSYADGFLLRIFI
jgi:hypothetical protein